MAERSVSLRLSPKSIAAFRSKNREAMRAAVEQTLRNEDRESSMLAGFLQDFCTHTVETYAHESLMVDCVEEDTPTRGKVCVSFSGEAYMGCKDADYLYQHSETLKYRIDLTRGELELTVDFPERRTTRDEL